VANSDRLGRKPTLTHHQQLEAVKRRDHGEPVRKIAHLQLEPFDDFEAGVVMSLEWIGTGRCSTER
jgi:hypothetical protein